MVKRVEGGVRGLGGVGNVRVLEVRCEGRRGVRVWVGVWVLGRVKVRVRVRLRVGVRVRVWARLGVRIRAKV